MLMTAYMRPTPEAAEKAHMILALLSGETMETAAQALAIAQKELNDFQEIAEKKIRFESGVVKEFNDEIYEHILQKIDPPYK